MIVALIAGLAAAWSLLSLLLLFAHFARASTHRHCDLCGHPVWGSWSLLDHYETSCRMPGHARDRAASLRDGMKATRS